MPFVTAASATPGERNEFAEEGWKRVRAAAGLTAVVAVLALLALWLLL